MDDHSPGLWILALAVFMLTIWCGRVYTRSSQAGRKRYRKLYRTPLWLKALSWIDVRALIDIRWARKHIGSEAILLTLALLAAISCLQVVRYFDVLGYPIIGPALSVALLMWFIFRVVAPLLFMAVALMAVTVSTLMRR
ncbi:hypothetical protein TPB0596_32430 [Tsukamurella pulmonis]|nr:hypothetical protein TPB0596_32430 [Tsukamurella pulmonis]